MRRRLDWSKRFTRDAKRLVKKNPSLPQDLRSTLAMLSEDASDPRLESHKLRGKLSGTWACSGGYDLRIVFEFTGSQSETILLHTVGTHDQVY